MRTEAADSVSKEAAARLAVDTAEAYCAAEVARRERQRAKTGYGAFTPDDLSARLT